MMTVVEIPQSPAAPADPEGGWGGGLFKDKRHLRSDARLAATMISLGTLSDEKTGHVIRAAFELAEAAASRGKVREFVAVMRIILAAATQEIAAKEQAAKRLSELNPPAAPLPLEQILEECYAAIRVAQSGAMPATAENANRPSDGAVS